MTAPMRQANELVERVARAIDPVNWKWLDTVTSEHPAYDTILRCSMARAQAAIDAIIPNDPTLAARLISDFDTDESESPVDYRPGDYRREVEVAKYVIGRIRGEGGI